MQKPMHASRMITAAAALAAALGVAAQAPPYNPLSPYGTSDPISGSSYRQSSAYPQSSAPSGQSGQGSAGGAYAPGSITFIPPGGTITPAAVTNNASSPGQAQKYLVRGQDCLWNLSGSFLNDPWSWNKIWELNPYVQNPNLIYPGDSLLIPGFLTAPAGMAVSAVQAQAFAPSGRFFEEETAGFPDSSAAGSAAAQTATEETRDAAGLSSTELALMQKKVFSAEFMAIVPFLWFDKDAKGEIAPGDGKIIPSSDESDFSQFDNVTIRPVVKGHSWQVGDTLEILRCDRTVYFHKTQATLVRRIGYARVEETGKDMARLVLYKIWDVVKAGDRVGRPAPFKKLVVGDLSDPQVNLVGSVFQRCETTNFPYLFQSFVIDRGSRDGVQMGDVFFSYPSTTAGKSDRPAKTPSLIASTAHVGEGSSTLVILRLLDKNLSPGDTVNLVKRTILN